MSDLPTRSRALLLGAVCAVLLLRLWAVFTEAFNWDELSFLYRVERSIALGTLMGGGRPGLAILPLMPVVGGCEDEVTALRHARLLWFPITTAYLAGIFVLLREVLRRAGGRHVLQAALLGTALTCLTPIFHRWSLQVRTDQLALAAATWASVLLLRSRERHWLAATAGLLYGLGFLVTQKAAYPAGLGAALATLEVLRERPLRLKPAFARAGIALGVFAAVVGAFYAATRDVSETPSFQTTVKHGLGALQQYGDQFGHYTYLEILVQQPVHLLLLLGLIAGTGAWLRSRKHTAGALPHAWLVLALGIGVALFHRSSFAYFWMTLGMFLGLALGLGLEATLRLLPGELSKRALLWASWGGLVLLWLPVLPETLSDRQAVQRDSYAFVQRHFAPTDAGMQLEGGLFCHVSEAPLPVVMHTHVLNFFHGAPGEQRVRELESEFRRRPIKYIIGAHTLRLFPWPPEAARIWREHFVPYHGPVMVPGRAFGGAAGTRIEFDVWVPGSYRWAVAADAGIALDGARIDPTQPVELERGVHSIELLTPASGALVWQLDQPPKPDPHLGFYDPRQIEEIAITRRPD